MKTPDSYRGREQTYVKHHLLSTYLEASEKIEYVQRRVRAQAKQEHRESRTRQRELFSSDNDIQIEESSDLSEVKTYWLDRLSAEPRRFGIEQLADMLEETGWFESDLQAAFGELVGEGSAANVDDEKKRRRKKYIHFDHNQGELNAWRNSYVWKSSPAMSGSG